jgi:hypothetical protein
MVKRRKKRKWRRAEGGQGKTEIQLAKTRKYADVC